MPTSQRRPTAGRTRSRRGQRHQMRILLDPDLWGLLAATFFATLVLLVSFFRGMDPFLQPSILIGAGLTFVVSYVATGLFVWYLHLLRERQVEADTESRRRAAGVGLDSGAPPAAGGATEEGP